MAGSRWADARDRGEKRYREACPRHHRTLARYFAVFAWKHSAGCVVVGRAAPERLLNLKQFRAKRLDWLQEDVAPWFPRAAPRMDKEKLEAFLLSRLTVPRGTLLSWPNLSTQAAGLGHTGLRAVEFHGRASIPDESAVVGSMSLIATGLLSIDGVPGFRIADAT